MREAARREDLLGTGDATESGAVVMLSSFCGGGSAGWGGAGEEAEAAGLFLPRVDMVESKEV